MKLFDFSSKMTPVFTSLQCTIFQSSKVIDYGLFNGPVNFSYFYNTTKSHTQSTIQKVLKQKSLPFKTPKLPSHRDRSYTQRENVGPGLQWAAVNLSGKKPGTASAATSPKIMHFQCDKIYICMLYEFCHTVMSKISV